MEERVLELDLFPYIEPLLNAHGLGQFREVWRKLYDAAANCENLKQTLTTVSDFAQAHGDKIGVAGGFLLASFLLYKSVTLGGEIEGYFDEIEELKGRFREQNAQTKALMEFHQQIPQVIASAAANDPKTVRQFFLADWKKSKQFYRNVLDMLDQVEDLLQSVIQAKTQAEVNAKLSGVVAVLSAFALVTTAPVSMPLWLYRTGLVLTTATSSGSCALSLKNRRDAQRAAEKLQVLKRHLRQQRNELDRLMEYLVSVVFNLPN